MDHDRLITHRNRDSANAERLNLRQQHGASKVRHSCFFVSVIFTLVLSQVRKVRHGFSHVLLPKPHDGVLKDTGVSLLREIRCLENPSRAFEESSWASVSVTGKIYVARGMPYRTNRLDCSHSSCFNDGSRLPPKRWRQDWPAWVDSFHSQRS